MAVKENTGLSDPGVPEFVAERGFDWPRLRFAYSVALYGGVLGAITVIVNFLSQFDFPDTPEHLPALQAALFALAGAVSGIILTGPMAYIIQGPTPFFHQRRRASLSLLVWFLIGFGYGVAFSMLLGGIFLPLSVNILDFVDGLISVPRLLIKAFDMLIAWPGLAIVLGTRLLITGIIAGVFFGGGAWLIDRFSASTDRTTSVYGPWAIALALSVALIAVILFVPESTLAYLG